MLRKSGASFLEISPSIRNMVFLLDGLWCIIWLISESKQTMRTGDIMVVTFCGHSHCPDTPELRAWLVSCVEELIAEGADKFYLGGYGDFDRIAASVVWKLKDKYPHIESVLVLAYLGREVDADKYDRAMHPPIESVPKRFAITARNRWLVENSDVLVAYVILDSGGAADTRRYAKRKKKQIINYKMEVTK